MKQDDVIYIENATGELLLVGKIIMVDEKTITIQKLRDSSSKKPTIRELFDRIDKENAQREQEKIDIDRIEGNVPQSERGKTVLVLNSIVKLSKDKKEITHEELLGELTKQGIAWDYEIDNILGKFGSQGLIFRISPNIIQRV